MVHEVRLLYGALSSTVQQKKEIDNVIFLHLSPRRAHKLKNTYRDSAFRQNVFLYNNGYLLRGCGKSQQLLDSFDRDDDIVWAHGAPVD